MTRETETRVLKDPIQYPIHPSLLHISQTLERKRTKSSLFRKLEKRLGIKQKNMYRYLFHRRQENISKIKSDLLSITRQV